MRSNHSKSAFALLVVLLIPLLATPLLAQSTGGAISGSVIDDSGAVIPGVTVTVTHRGTGLTRMTVSLGDGSFSLPLLPAGSYDVVSELDGFSRSSIPNVVVNVGSEAKLRITMRPGVAEALTVTGEAPVVEMTRTSVSSVVNETMVANLPVNGRNFIDFVLTTPGVVRDVRTGDISFAGQRGTLNSLVVDGADNNNTFFGQALGRTGSGRAPYQFSQDAVQEFQVKSNAYSAEYGRAGGAVINVITKSGTNTYQGSTFFFYRDRDLNANDYINQINNRPKGPYQFDQYGLSVGGPIVRDKHFFFANYDAQRNTIPNLVVLGLPSNLPTDADTVAGLAKLQALGESYDRGQNQDVWLLKTDSHVLGSLLSLRYNRQEFTGKNFENGGITNSREHTGDSLVNTDTLSANFTTPIGSRFFNEVRVQWAKDKEPGQANSDRPEATIRQGGQTVLVIGRNFFSPRETTIERFQIADTATVVAGAHTVKLGFDYNRDDILNFFPGNFSGSYTFDSIAQFNRGVPSRYVQAFAGPGTSGPLTNPDIRETALFVQDDWRVTPSLTVNLGVRYDQQEIAQPSVRNPDAQLAAAGIDTSFIPEDDDNVGIRTGFAWTLAPQTVVRGGYGTFYGRTPAIMIGTAHSNNGINVQTITFTGNQVPTYPNIFTSIPTGAAIPRPTIVVFDRNYENPMTQQASLGIEHGITPDISIGVSWLHVRGDDLPRSRDINVGSWDMVQIPVQNGTPASVRRYSATRPFSNFGRIIQFESTANSEYDGLTIEATRRFSANWQARLSYTYGTVRDDRPDATAVVPSSSDDAKYAMDPLFLSDDWSYGDNDVRHRATLSGVWYLGDGSRFTNRVAQALLGGWTLSGIVNYQTGQPYSAMVNADLNNDGNNRNDRAPGFERNSFRLPDQFTVDPRITRDIDLGANLRLQLIAEAFNVFNESNVSQERNVYYAFTGGTLVPQTNFGSPTASAGPRIVQLAAKLKF